MMKKKTVLFVAFPEWGGIMPITALAKVLQSRNWNVVSVLPRSDSELFCFHNQQMSTFPSPQQRRCIKLKLYPY
jgi:UDP:flavonoid glycosyltransferase YjiC (YdhE family)